MKRIAYFFLLIFLLSCGQRSELRKDHVRLQFRDSSFKEYYLLAVRDSAIIVSPVFDADIPVLIPFSKIAFLYSSNNAVLNGTAVGGLVGCGAAIISSVIIFKNPTLGTAVAVGILIAPSIVIGAVIGSVVSHDTDETLDPHKPDDLEYIKSLSRYIDGEPPELKKLQ